MPGKGAAAVAFTRHARARQNAKRAALLIARVRQRQQFISTICVKGANGKHADSANECVSMCACA